MVGNMKLDVQAFTGDRRGQDDPRVWIGLDIGGTKIAAAKADAEGIIQQLVRERTRKATPEELLGQIVSVVEQLLAPADELVSVGIGLPGQVDPEAGHTFSPYNLGWPNVVQIRKPLQERFGVPVFIDNDLNTAIIAELTQGVGRTNKNFCYVTVGTGVAAGLVFDGKLFRGAPHLAGELGHVVVDPTARDCVCGAKGCLEALVSGPAIARSYNEVVGMESGVATAEKVFSAARQGDAAALAVVRDTAKYLAIGINNLAALVDPEVVTIGGGVSDAGDILFSHLEEALKRWLSGVVDKRVEIRPATYGSKTGVIGSLMLAYANHLQAV